MGFSTISRVSLFEVDNDTDDSVGTGQEKEKNMTVCTLQCHFWQQTSHTLLPLKQTSHSPLPFTARDISV